MDLHIGMTFWPIMLKIGDRFWSRRPGIICIIKNKSLPLTHSEVSFLKKIKKKKKKTIYSYQCSKHTICWPVLSMFDCLWIHEVLMLLWQKWGSDHLALVCELAFADDVKGTWILLLLNQSIQGLYILESFVLWCAKGFAELASLSCLVGGM